MGLSAAQLFLIGLLTVTMAVNLLTLKWQNRHEVLSSDDEVRYFRHPFLQTWFLFLGETACLPVFKYLMFYYSRKEEGLEDKKHFTRGNRNFQVLVLLPPALCDLCAASLKFAGLTFTYVSSMLMLGGSVIIFTATFAKMFLDHILLIREYVGIAFVVIGVTLTVISDSALIEDNVFKVTEQNVTMSTDIEKEIGHIILGDILIIIGNMISAVQYLWEGHYVFGKDIPPLQHVGWDGVFGLTGATFLMVPFHFISMAEPLCSNARGTVEDIPDALTQMSNEHNIIYAMVFFTISVAVSSVVGVMSVDALSLTTQMVLTSLKTFVIWMVTLAMLWEEFRWLQIIAFICLVTGQFLYYDVLLMQLFTAIVSLVKGERINRQPSEIPPTGETMTGWIF